MRAVMRVMGRKGGFARAAKLSKAQRQAIARLGGKARWAKRKARPKP